MVNFLKRALIGALALCLAVAPLAPIPAQAQAVLSIGGINVPGACAVTGASPQICNGFQGLVTTGTLTTAAVTNAAYTITNSSVATTSRVGCQIHAYSGTIVTNGIPVIVSCVPGAGSLVVNVTNVHASNAMNGTLIIGFTVYN